MLFPSIGALRRIAVVSALAVFLTGANALPSQAEDSGLMRSAKSVLLLVGAGVLAIDALIDKAQELMRHHPEDRQLTGMVASLGGSKGELEGLKEFLTALTRQQMTQARYEDWCEEYRSESEQTLQRMKVLRSHLRMLGYSEAAVAQIEQNAEDAARDLIRAGEECW